MTQNYYFKRLLFLVFISLVYSSCNTDANQKLVEIKSIKPLQSKKVKKDFNKKKGIEIMADFVADIMKPIGAKKSSYKDGFMMTEHQKAMKRRGSFTTKNVNTIEFKERGPVNVPGRVRKVVVAPDNSDKWYAGSVGGGLWVTEDAGATWKNLTDYKIPNLSTSTVAISNKNPKVIYLGTGEPFGNLDAIGGIGILKSINGGETWEYLENTSEFGGIGRLAVDPENENDLVVAD